MSSVSITSPLAVRGLTCAIHASASLVYPAHSRKYRQSRHSTCRQAKLCIPFTHMPQAYTLTSTYLSTHPPTHPYTHTNTRAPTHPITPPPTPKTTLTHTTTHTETPMHPHPHTSHRERHTYPRAHTHTHRGTHTPPTPNTHAHTHDIQDTSPVCPHTQHVCDWQPPFLYGTGASTTATEPLQRQRAWHV